MVFLSAMFSSIKKRIQDACMILVIDKFTKWIWTSKIGYGNFRYSIIIDMWKGWITIVCKTSSLFNYKWIQINNIGK